MTNDNTNPEPIDWDRLEAEVTATPNDDDPTAAAELAVPDGAPVLVDSPHAQQRQRLSLAGLRAAQRRPIVPAWARSASELHDMARWATGFAGHTMAYHLVRAPKYAAKLGARAPAAPTGGLWLAAVGAGPGRRTHPPGHRPQPRPRGLPQARPPTRPPRQMARGGQQPAAGHPRPLR